MIKPNTYTWEEFLAFSKVFATTRPAPKNSGGFEEYLKKIWDEKMVDVGNGKRKVK